MRALILNGTLKPPPEPSSTEELAADVARALGKHGVETEPLRLTAYPISPGVVSEAVVEGDRWPEIREKVIGSEIVIFATPTWLGQPSSEIKRAFERLDALLSETAPDGTPLAFNRVAGFIVVGNEDGAHHCIAEMAQAAIDIGFTVPGQSWTYWNRGPGPGDEEYLTTGDRGWTRRTAALMAHNLVHAARALEAQPIPAPPKV
ncbi:MAG: flavodoxin family protein [Baekduia sp.]